MSTKEHPETAPEEPASDDKPDAPVRPKWRGYVSSFLFIAMAPVLAILITAYVFQSYEVQGRSMQTTLYDKDRLIIWKLPRTLAKITHHAYIPHRDDIIVFTKHGLYNDTTLEKQLIKRVIGLPGDRVVVRDGHITIYNAQNPHGYNPDSNHDFTANIGSPTLGNTDLTVPVGEVFVSGDNRTDSYDSRSFGTLRADDITGKLIYRILPTNSLKSFM